MANPEGAIDKKILERGYWIATHRIVIKKWLGIALYILIAFIYLYFFVQFGVYMFRYSEWEELVARSVVNDASWEHIDALNAPLDLEFSEPLIFSLGDNRYDFIVEVFNPNPQWAIQSFNYTFSYGEDTAIDGSSFILPEESKFLTVFSHQALAPLAVAPEFVATDYEWLRMERAPPLSWIFTETPVFSPRQISIEDGQQTVIPARVSWSVQNGSTLNIRKVIWQVALYSGKRLVSVSNFQAERLEFLDERHFEYFLHDVAARIDRIVVTPLVDVFDPEYTYLR